MSTLSGDVGELRFTVQITRAATGKVEEVELVGKLTEEQLKELTDGSDTLDSGAKCGD